MGVVATAFATRGDYGQVEWRFTWDNFARFAGFGPFGFEPLYPMIVLRSRGMAAATSVLCLGAALPLTFFIARLPDRWRRVALMGVIIPYWTNLLIRTYAWQIVFSAQGWPARFAAAVGLISEGEALYPGTFAVFVGLTCDYLPFLALPLYASVEKIDWSLAEAAADLGASGWRVFRHALLPQIVPGLVAGFTLVFIAATGQFVIPDLLGGAQTVLLGNAIQQQFGSSRDWPFGSAIACLTMALVMVGLWVFGRMTETETETGSGGGAGR
jgi:spermidine/putrescine transport system permease protein